MGAFGALNAKIGGEIEHVPMREEMANAPEEPRATKRRGRHPEKALTDADYGLVWLVEARAWALANRKLARGGGDRQTRRPASAGGRADPARRRRPGSSTPAAGRGGQGSKTARRRRASREQPHRRRACRRRAQITIVIRRWSDAGVPLAASQSSYRQRRSAFRRLAEPSRRLEHLVGGIESIPGPGPVQPAVSRREPDGDLPGGRRRGNSWRIRLTTGRG